MQLIRAFKDSRPESHPSAFISEAAYIVGDVKIGANASVWPGAVIRGDFGKITIGKNSVIQDNCVIHTDTSLDIGENVLITHGAVVHGIRIGNNVLLGINAVILEGAEIGDYCLIGASTLILQGESVPSRSLVIGVPGKSRPISPEHLSLLTTPTANYVANAKAYKQQGLHFP